MDEDGLYDPAQLNDRLLLGLKGTMSEAELHVLRARLIGGQRAKAARGELEMPLPVGLIQDAGGQVVLDPDQQVQAAVRAFVSTFDRTGSATATVRHFREEGLLFPRRVRTGPDRGALVWAALGHSRVLRALKNPRYAGAFAYGRSRTRHLPGGRESAVRLPREEWHTLIKDAHPGYISWSEYERNLARLHENAQAYGGERRASPPREGPALLATDLPRLWRDERTPQRERKRLLRLVVEDVTLTRTERILVQVRFRDGATRTLELPLPLSAAQLRKVDPAVVAEVDRLLNDHTEAEVIELLNPGGFRPGVADRFSPKILYTLRHAYHLEDRFTRLRRQGMLTLAEISRLLGADPSTVKVWALQGHIPSQVYNGKGQRLFERPARSHLPCQRCGGPIPARPALRRGKKWCSLRCAQATYHDRKRAAREAIHDGLASDQRNEVQSVA